MRDLVLSEAMRQRKTGSKFSASSITEASKIVFTQTLNYCIDSLVSNWDGEVIKIRGLKWWDSTNGNTYHSVRMIIPQNDYASGRIVDTPFEYGYGDQWQWTALETLIRIGFHFSKNVPMSDQPLSFADAPLHEKARSFRRDLHSTRKQALTGDDHG
jgi:hypothetical protein